MTVPTVNVDRNNPIPLYYQVAQQLEQAIESGELAVGDRLENEVALADHYGLSRPTMRSAIGYLVDKGLLVRQRGVGTRVIRRTVDRPVGLTSLYEDLEAAGQVPTTTVLLLERQAADAAVASKLAVAAGSEVVHMERLRFAQSLPFAVLRNWLPVDIAGDFSEADLEANGLYDLLRRNGFVMRDATQRIGAEAAAIIEARQLRVRKGSPLLTMERLSFDKHARPIELGVHSYDATRYSVSVTLQHD